MAGTIARSPHHPAVRAASRDVRRARPAVSGRPPHRARPPAVYPLLLGLVALITLVGLVMVLSASSVAAQRAYGNPWYFFERQILWVGLGTAALAVGAHVDYRRLRYLGMPIMLGAGVLLVAVLVPGIGVNVNGSARWLGVGQWRIQPSELAKLALVIFAADLLTRRADRMDDVRFTFVPVALATLLTAFLVLMQPDMGTTVVIVGTAFAMVFVAGTPIWTLCKSFLSVCATAFVLGLIAPYRRNRMLTFLHPFKDPGNTGYQIVQSYVGLGSGGLFGRGLGNGVEKWGYLPNPYTDFIFAAIGEETGLVGTVVVVLLFVAFAVLGVRAAVRAPDRFGTLLATGITAWVTVQALLNIGAVIGILPVTGVPLPFVSFGGSSLVIAMGAAGILANVARNGR
jgi:cell division protein FtsW